MSRTPARVVCACGLAERWALPFSTAGTTGFTSAVANFAPEVSLRLRKALRAWDRSGETLRLWDAFARIERLRARGAGAPNVPVIKCAMDLVGLRGGHTGPPLSPATARQVREMLHDLGVAGDAGRQTDPAPLPA